ncbi:T9SS type A sorting domain-containing protein [uncultured Pontibacter sp.]|uniref:T9SS type A sorting domain-containing protein n=1 Tax=uncultured Pontibacter sp. TaxID=453356 RepID=UPI002624609C|nr:T9SS type A sorting domain-containing protein [uncultured Pontibacter sp.]
MRIQLPFRNACISAFIFPLLLTLLFSFFNFQTAAQTKTAIWTGEGTQVWFWKSNTDDWNNPDNWNPRVVPDAVTQVFIRNVANAPVIAESNAITIHSLTVDAGATLYVKNQNLKVTILNNLTNNGAIYNQGSDMAVNGNWANNSNYIESLNYSYSPTMEFGGNGMTIGGTSSCSFNNLVIKGDITLSKSIAIKPITYAVSKFEVLGIFNPGLHKVNFASIPTEGFRLGDGATLMVMAPAYDGNYGHFPSTMFVTSTIDYAANGNQTVLASNYGRLNISGGGVKTLAGNTTVSPISGLTQLNVLAGTLDLGAFTLNRSRTGDPTVTGGTLTVANGAFLKIGGTGTFPSGYATNNLGNTSTVEYSGSNQAVSQEAYGNLTLSGTGTKTMPATAMVISGNFTGTGTASFTAMATLDVKGDLALNSSSIFNGGNFTHTINGNWTNNATFSGATSTIVMNGAGKQIRRNVTGTATFNNLTISGSGISITAPTLTVTGHLSTTGSGTLTQVKDGLITLTGTDKYIQGNGITFQNLTVNGSIKTSSSFEIKDNLTVNTGKTLNASAGRILMSGSDRKITNAGALSVFGLQLTSNISTESSFTVKSELIGHGKLTATAGTIEFSGTTTYGGIHQLNHVNVSGVRLRMVANANLTVAGNFVVQPGSAFDAVSNRPNTVTFNGTAVQSVPSLAYHHVTFKNAGSKQAAGSLSVNGDLLIDSNSNFDAGSFNHTIIGNWENYGNFLARESTITLNGAADTFVTGSTVFKNLTISKNTVGVTVTLNNDVTTAVLNMNNGLLVTRANKVTVTENRFGDSWVVGTIRRNHTFAAGIPYALNAPNAYIKFATVSGVTDISSTVVHGNIADFPANAAANGRYIIAVASGTYSNATLQLQYLEEELNGNSENNMQLFRQSGNAWASEGYTQRSIEQNWINKSDLSDINGVWTVSSASSVYRWKGTISSAWENPGNWDSYINEKLNPTSYIPGATDIVELGGTSPTNQPRINSNVNIKLLRFVGNAPIDLSLLSGGLTIEGNLSAKSGGSEDESFAEFNSSAVNNTLNIGSQSLSIGGNMVLHDGTGLNNVILILGNSTATVRGDIDYGTGIISLGSSTFKLLGNFLNANRYTFDKGTGTFIYEGPNSQLIGEVYYNNLTIDKTAGVATLKTETEGWVAGDITVNSGTLSIPGGSYILEKNVIQNGGLLTVGSSKIVLEGNWSKNGGTFEAGTSTVTFTGDALVATSPLTFNIFQVAKDPADTFTITGDILINKEVTLNSGIVNLATSTLNRSAAGGHFKMGKDATLLLSGSNFPSNYGTVTLDAGSTVKYVGMGTQEIEAVTYGNLEIANGGTTTKKLKATTLVDGDFIINSGASLNADNETLILKGNLTNNGAFIPGIPTKDATIKNALILSPSDKSVKTIGGTSELELNNFIVLPDAKYKLENNLKVNGSFNVAGKGNTAATDTITNAEFDAGVNNVSVSGDLVNQGVLKGSGKYTLTGNRLQHAQLFTPILPSTSMPPTISFEGTIPPVFNSTAQPNFGNVIISNSGGILASADWTVLGSLEVKPGGLFDGGPYSHTIMGGIDNQGTFKSKGIINYIPTDNGISKAPLRLYFGADESAFQSTGTLRINGSEAVVLGGTIPATLHHLALENTNAAGISLAELEGTNIRITGDMSISQGTTFYGGDKKHTIDGNLTINGTLDGREADFTFTSSKDNPGEESEIAVISGVGTTSVKNLIVGDKARVNMTKEIIHVYENFVHNGLLFDGKKAELKFKGTLPSVLTSSNSQEIQLQHLHVAKAADATVTLQSPLAGVTSLMVESGTLDAKDMAIATSIDPEGEKRTDYLVFSVSNGATYSLSGNNALPFFKNYKFGEASTIKYYGTDQKVKSVQYGNLQLLNSGSKTFEGDTARIAGALTIAKDVQVITPTIVEYNGHGAQTVAALQYNQLALRNAGEKKLAAGITGVASAIYATGNATLNAAGNGVTVDYNGTMPQEVLPTNYYNLKLSNGSTKRFANTTGIAADFTIVEGATADLTSASTIDFNGARDQLVPALKYNNLLVSAPGIKTLQGDATVEKQLKLTSGQLRTSNYTITLDEVASTISETQSAFVTGTVHTQRLLASGAEDFGGIGISVTPSSSPGTVKVTRVTGPSSALGNGNNIQRYFQLQPSTASKDLKADITMNYLNHEMGSNTTENDLIVYWSDSEKGWWRTITPSASPANNQVTASDVSPFGYFTLGRAISPLPVELLYFEAAKSGKDALLSWATATERDNNGFAIDVSTDGYTYREIGYQKSKAENASVLQKYTFKDTENGKSGIRYYRLRQLDKNGKETLFNTKTVDFGSIANTTIAAYPNPFTHDLNLSVNATTAGKVSIKVYDLAGKMLFFTSQSVAAGATQIPLQMDKIKQTGMYMITVDFNATTYRLKVIKQ